MFGPEVDQESLTKAMTHYDGVKKNGGTDKKALEIAIEWYLIYEEEKYGIMS